MPRCGRTTSSGSTTARCWRPRSTVRLQRPGRSPRRSGRRISRWISRPPPPTAASISTSAVGALPAARMPRWRYWQDAARRRGLTRHGELIAPAPAVDRDDRPRSRHSCRRLVPGSDADRRGNVGGVGATAYRRGKKWPTCFAASERSASAAERARVSAFDDDARAIAAPKQAAGGTHGLKPKKPRRATCSGGRCSPPSSKSFDAAVFDPPRQGAPGASARACRSSADPIVTRCRAILRRLRATGAS